MWPGIVATHPLTPSCPAAERAHRIGAWLFGFRRIGLGPLTLTWYFRGIPGILQAAGNRVLVTRVHPTAGVARRARKLGEQIQEAFPNEPVHLIGHSMGGLDARALIADPVWQGRVLSLTTIATPSPGLGDRRLRQAPSRPDLYLAGEARDRASRVPRRDPRCRRRV